MPVEILIAPAATAAESASDFWKYGLPVVSLVAGILLKWGLDLVIERRRDVAEKAKRMVERRDALQARQAESERSNLLALQPLLSRQIRGLFQAFSDAQARMAETQAWNVEAKGTGGELAREARFEMTPIRARLHNRELAQEITEFVGLHIDDTLSEREAKLLLIRIGAKFESLTAKIGDEIRKLENAELQLTEPPVR